MTKCFLKYHHQFLNEQVFKSIHLSLVKNNCQQVVKHPLLQNVQKFSNLHQIPFVWFCSQFEQFLGLQFHHFWWSNQLLRSFIDTQTFLTTVYNKKSIKKPQLDYESMYLVFIVPYTTQSFILKTNSKTFLKGEHILLRDS